MRDAIAFALYTGWAIAWLAVTAEYGRAAYHSWRQHDGRWGGIPGECIGFVRWFARELWRDVRHGFHPHVEVMPGRYSSGHLLRFFISISAFLCGAAGLAASTMDRGHWPIGVLALLLATVAFSTGVALGHLSVAWYHRPRRWRLFVLALAAWIPIAAASAMLVR